VDCEALVEKFFRLDGEEWEVIEADASSGLVKYARLCEGVTEARDLTGRAGRGMV
jgi:hypothetical protein